MLASGGDASSEVLSNITIPPAFPVRAERIEEYISLASSRSFSLLTRKPAR